MLREGRERVRGSEWKGGSEREWEGGGYGGQQERVGRMNGKSRGCGGREIVWRDRGVWRESGWWYGFLTRNPQPGTRSISEKRPFQPVHSGKSTATITSLYLYSISRSTPLLWRTRRHACTHWLIPLRAKEQPVDWPSTLSHSFPFESGLLHRFLHLHAIVDHRHAGGGVCGAQVLWITTPARVFRENNPDLQNIFHEIQLGPHARRHPWQVFLFTRR